MTIGLQGTSYATTETAGPFSVCAQMFNGNLEREVSMTLVSSDGTAVGMRQGLELIANQAYRSEDCLTQYRQSPNVKRSYTAKSNL